MASETQPLRLFLAVSLALICITAFLISKKGRKWVKSLDLKTLTLLHVVRVPVEIVLYWLFLHEAVPELMTFAGRNFDILAGITALFVYYFGFVKNKVGKKWILFWNIACLLLL